MSDIGYLQIKIREQNEKIVELEEKVKQLGFEVYIHNDQITREKELFNQAFQTLKIKPVMEKVFKDKIEKNLRPILYKNKKTMDTNIKNTMYVMAVLSEKFNLCTQILAAIVQTLCTKNSDEFILFSKNLKEMDTKMALQLFDKCSEDAKHLVMEIEQEADKINALNKGEQW